jgi:predicted O-methyltransferase YrrM
MTPDVWQKVDTYITSTLHKPDDVLDACVKANKDAELPPIAVSPPMGRMLKIFAEMIGARRILEVGTLGGYSTIWLARSLPQDGSLVTLEYEQRHANIALANIKHAGLDHLVTIRVGKALNAMEAMVESGEEPFDFVFIDADKVNSPNYFSLALSLTKKGSLIVVDNVVRGGAVVDPNDTSPDIEGNRKLNEVMGATTKVEVTEIQTVGMKGYDGFALALVQ